MLHIDARCFTEPLHVEISDENFSRSASSSSEWGGTHYRSMSNSMLRSRSSSLLPITNAPLKSPSSSFISPRRTSKGKSCFKPFLAFVAVCLLFGGVFLYTQQSSKAASLASIDGSELITEAAHRRKSSLEGGQLNWQTGAEDEGLVQALQAENDVVFDSSRLASKQQGHKQAATDPQYSAPKTRQPQQEAQHQGHTQAQQQLSDNIGQEQQQHGHPDQAYQAKQQQQQQQAQQLVKAEASLLDPQQAQQQQQQQQMAAAEQQAQQVAVQQQQAQQAEAHLLHAQHPPTEVPAPRTPPSLYESGLSAVDIHGNVVHMSDLRGRVTLILNVASYCGYTQPNYSGLKEIYERYNAYGFEILAFPCNQFGNQEPGNAEEILHFVETHFQSKFPLMSKVDVNGPEQHPVFAFLKQHTPPMPGHPPNEDISWNFNKFLLDKWGHPMKRYASDLVQFEVETDVYNELIKPFPPATSTQ